MGDIFNPWLTDQQSCPSSGITGPFFAKAPKEVSLIADLKKKGLFTFNHLWQNERPGAFSCV